MSRLEHVDLLAGLNINPVPLQASNHLSNVEWLMEIQAKVNTIIDVGNSWEETANKYTDDRTKVLEKAYEDLMLLIKKGDIIADKSIGVNKINDEFISTLQDVMLQYVHDSTKFVRFGIDKKGYFVADMPESWSEIVFYTNVNGELCLEILDMGVI